MAEAHHSKSERKRERQPISVPFVWEERPGVPKKDWKPFTPPVEPPPPPPVKFVVSVPFGWEEKPGTPLPYFLQPPNESCVVVNQQHSITGYGNDDRCEGDESSESELDTCSVETDESFSSAKSLLANGLISTAAISSAVPVEESSLALVIRDGAPLQGPGSPASETDSTCSYPTGTTSLAGASFLEWLFPLLVPNSNVGFLEMAPSQNANVPTKEYLHGSNCSQVRRPLLTLGDLIAMSRRRSCQRKVNNMHKQRSMVTLSSLLLLVNIFTIRFWKVVNCVLPSAIKIILWMTGLYEAEHLWLLPLWNRQRNQSAPAEVEETAAAEVDVKTLPSWKNIIAFLLYIKLFMV